MQARINYYFSFFKSKLMKFPLILMAVLISFALYAQPASPEIPAVHSNLYTEGDSLYFLTRDSQRAYEVVRAPRYTLEQMQGQPQGTDTGLAFDFGDLPKGTLHYGFIPYGDSRHPQPVFFKNPSTIEAGKAEIEIIDNLSGLYDMIGWKESGQGTIGYRVIDSTGQMLYDGIVGFEGTGPFTIDTVIIEGPFVSKLRPDGATLSFVTNDSIRATVSCEGKDFNSPTATTHHEIDLHDLSPAADHSYNIAIGNRTYQFAFRTAPKPGSRQPFTFAYTSDSRAGQGGGERDVYGANYYIMKKMLALATQQKASFMQFSGDLINGYLTSPEETDLQYANWKRAVQPFAHYLPINISMGNHEALMRIFQDSSGEQTFLIDRFPYATESAEAVFARNFANPENGPDSEDGAVYDPNPDQTDFPSYRENVFYYTYDNVAVIVLNSDYFYAPSTQHLRTHSGNMHGYLMDQQLAWLETTLNSLENDNNIDHVFVTQHTPAFPNGGHVGDDMWYRGDNGFRPFVNGKALAQGIIERRDQYLDLLVNQSSKVRAILTGDEHNYNRLRLSPETDIYPDPYFFDTIQLSRTIYQINNGAAGAPYYAQEQTPWSADVSNFTTQNALVLFHVDGKAIRVEVLNPDTLEEVDEFELVGE